MVNISTDNLIMSLSELLQRLKNDRDNLEDRINQVEKDLKALKNGASIGSNGQTSQRRQRGSNRKAVKELFEQNPILTLTIPDIAQELGIPQSSARAAVLQLKEKDIIERSSDGRWHKKQSHSDEDGLT